MIDSYIVGPNCNFCGCYCVLLCEVIVELIIVHVYDLFHCKGHIFSAHPVLVLTELQSERSSLSTVTEKHLNSLCSIECFMALLMSRPVHPLPLGMRLWRCPGRITGVLSALQNKSNKYGYITMMSHHNTSHGTHNVAVRVLGVCRAGQYTFIEGFTVFS